MGWGIVDPIGFDAAKLRSESLRGDAPFQALASERACELKSLGGYGEDRLGFDPAVSANPSELRPVLPQRRETRDS